MHPFITVKIYINIISTRVKSELIEIKKYKCIAKVPAEKIKFIIIKKIKCLWLFNPIHVDNHGQWWSCLNIHKPHWGQWYTLKSLAILQVEQYFKK